MSDNIMLFAKATEDIKCGDDITVIVDNKTFTATARLTTKEDTTSHTYTREE